MKKIILSGYMGSGKSTLAQLLQRETGMNMLDLDEFIEKKEQKSVAELFASKGEIYFRKAEHEALKEVLNSKENLILSLGGGTPCYSGNDELLKKADAYWIYLKALPATLFDRLNQNASNRPLLKGKTPEEMMEFIAKNLFDRSYYYNQASFKIDTDGKTPGDIVSEIKKILA